MKRGHQVLGFVPVLCAALGNFLAGAKLLGHDIAGGAIERPRAAGEQKILGAVFFVNLVFVRQVIANHGHAKVARLDDRLDGLHYRRPKRLPFVLRIPGGLFFEIAGVLAQAHHRFGDRFVRDTYESLRTALRSPGVPINFDETIDKIYDCVVLHPVGSKLQPVSGIPGLVVAN